MIKKTIAIILAWLSVINSTIPFMNSLFREKVEHRYIVCHEMASDENAQKLIELYGENNPENEIMYAMGVGGPLLLTDSQEIIANKTQAAFELAEKYNIPIWFQIDDINNQYELYSAKNATCEKWYEDEDNIEKVGFGDSYLAAPYWYNWGSWCVSSASPCLNSPKFVAFIKSQLENGFLPVLKQWVEKFKTENKEYLFAGVSVGWETRIADYSDMPLGTVDQDGNAFDERERGLAGYRALENLGYTAEKLEAEAKEQGISVKRLTYNLLAQVIHDYAEMISKEIFDIGIDKKKIFTHFVMDKEKNRTDDQINYIFPPIWSAVNDYSTPGFTNGFDTNTDMLIRLKRRIAEADSSQKNFGIVEGYGVGLDIDIDITKNYFQKLFRSGSIVVAIYGFFDTETSSFYFKKSPDGVLSRAIRDLINKKNITL